MASERVTIAQIAEQAEVSASTVYAICGSKEGILRALMTGALFGEQFRAAVAKLEGESDPVRLIALTAEVSLAVYEGQSVELGLLRGATPFSPALRKIEQEFEKMRFSMQEDRVRRLFAESKQKEGLDLKHGLPRRLSMRLSRAGSRRRSRSENAQAALRGDQLEAFGGDDADAETRPYFPKLSTKAWLPGMA